MLIAFYILGALLLAGIALVVYLSKTDPLKEYYRDCHNKHPVADDTTLPHMWGGK